MAGKLECPAGLSADAQGIWERLVGQLEQSGILEPVDETGLAVLCSEIALWRIAEKDIASRGLVLTAPTGQVKINPAAKFRDGALKQIKQFLVQFGLTPAARGRTKGMEPGGAQADGLELFLQG